MFDPLSRYYTITQYTVTDRQGRTVTVVAVPPAPQLDLLGYHVLKQGQRLDHLANKYNKDPAGFWRICELNDVMLAEDLTEQTEIAIPQISQ
jgi:hypothetical protein